MAAGMDRIDEMPVVKELKDFNQKSGNRLERMIFNNRMAVLIVCAIVTLLLAWQATKLVFNASFEKMIPQSQPYIRNYLENKKELRGLGNSIRVVVENTQGDIFDPAYLEALKQINDEKFRLVKQYGDMWGTMGNDDALIYIRRWLEVDEQVHQLRSKYVMDVSHALPGKKTAAFFQLDRRISMMMDIQLASQMPLAILQDKP